MGGIEKMDRQEQFLLASSPGAKPRKVIGSGDSKTKTNTRKEERVSKAELEESYKVDSFIFNAVNVAVQLIMSAGYKITAKKASVRKFFENFVEEISKVGADSTWEEVLTRIYQDSYIYGGPYNELVWNEADDKIVDLKILDPKVMDFARDGNGNIVLDENEKPIGFTQDVPYEVDPEAEDYGDPIPESVTTGGNKIFILAKRISYIPLYTSGAGFEGMGKIEPAYKATIWKLNLLKAGAESASRRGFSPIIATVGTENVHPTPQMVANVLEKLKTLDYSKYMAIPNYVTLDTLSPKSIETYEEFLKYLTAMQSAALGIPVPFVTGLGEDTNRSTLGTQLEVLKLSLNNLAQRECKKIEKYIFKPIADAEGFDEVPKLEWGKITFEYETNTQSGSKKGNKESDGVEEDKDKEEEDDKKLEGNTSAQNRGSPLNNSYQNQGIKIDKKKKKNKKKSSS